MNFARLRGSLRVRRANGVVLCYHRVASLLRDPQLLAVTPEHFAAHLDYLSERFELVHLSQMTSAGPTALPRVAITFDDGYADNLLAAKPLLEERRVPATVFICTGNLGTRREFWWDELDRVVLDPDTLPAALEITVGDSHVSWSQSDEDARAPGWNVRHDFDPSSRQRLYRELAPLIRPLPVDARDAVLAELRAWANVGELGRESHRSLTEGEVAALAASPCIQVGSHSVTHPVLASQAPDTQLREIESSRGILRQLTGQGVDSFAYPFGGSSDYGSATVSALREAGFTRACTTTPAPVVAGTDLLQIPRVLVEDSDSADLHRILAPFVRS